MIFNILEYSMTCAMFLFSFNIRCRRRPWSTYSTQMYCYWTAAVLIQLVPKVGYLRHWHMSKIWDPLCALLKFSKGPIHMNSTVTIQLQCNGKYGRQWLYLYGCIRVHGHKTI